jgi:hypothetical protein
MSLCSLILSHLAHNRRFCSSFDQYFVAILLCLQRLFLDGKGKAWTEMVPSQWRVDVPLVPTTLDWLLVQTAQPALGVPLPGLRKQRRLVNAVSDQLATILQGNTYRSYTLNGSHVILLSHKHRA